MTKPILITSIDPVAGAEDLGHHVWLRPSGVRPDRFEEPRYWTSPTLQEPGTVISLVLLRPNVEDVTRIVLSYGTKCIQVTLQDLVARQELTTTTAKEAARMLDDAIAGIRAFKMGRGRNLDHVEQRRAALITESAVES